MIFWQTKQNITIFNNTMKDLSNLSILAANMRSSYKNLDKKLKLKWTFIKLTETWGKRNTIEQQFIPGYNHVFDNRPKRTGGAVTYISMKKISYKVRKDLKLAESVFIEVSKSIFKKSRNIILGVIYRKENILIQIYNEKV